MSLDLVKRRILCDSVNCAAHTPVPITLVTEGKESGSRSSAAGWAFVAGTSEDRHYCPHCTEKIFSLRTR